MGKSGVRHMGEMGRVGENKYLENPDSNVRYGKKWGATYGRNGCGGRNNKYLGDELDSASARTEGHLRTLTIGRRDRGAAGERHTERLGERVHRRSGAHRIAVALRWRR